MFTRVVVGVDGRAGGRDALALAQQLVTSQSQLVLANVYGTSALRGAAGAGWEAEYAHHLLSCARQDQGLECRTMVRLDSSPGRGLHRLAQHERARLAHAVDLLVVGSRGQGPLGRFVNGSVSSHLARHSACPLLVVPRAVTEPAPRASDGPSRDLHVPVGPAS